VQHPCLTTALQAGRSPARFPMVYLEFSFNWILLSALLPWGRLSLSQKWVPWIFPGGVKASSTYGWQPYHHHVQTVLKYWSLKLLKPAGPAPCPGMYRDCSTFTFIPVSRVVTAVQHRDKTHNRWNTKCDVHMQRKGLQHVNMKHFNCD